MARYGDHAIVLQLIADYSPRRLVFKFLLVFTALGLILLGMANPRLRHHRETIEKTEADIMFCLDISNSMRARDIKPDRMERTKMAVSRMIDRFEKDQAGLLVFAGSPQLLFPLSPDHAGAKMFLQTASPDMISEQGTAIGAALELATSGFNTRSAAKKIIILITDGENHEDDALNAARQAAAKGITIFTVGMGTPEGSPIPMETAGSNIEYKKDENGTTVISRIDEQMLARIAEAGNGSYVRASNGNDGLDEIYRAIEALDKGESESVDVADYENLYPYLMAAGLLLLVMEFFVSGRKTRLTRNLHIFSKPGAEYVLPKKTAKHE